MKYQEIAKELDTYAYEDFVFINKKSLDKRREKWRETKKNILNFADKICERNNLLEIKLIMQKLKLKLKKFKSLHEICPEGYYIIREPDLNNLKLTALYFFYEEFCKKYGKKLNIAKKITKNLKNIFLIDKFFQRDIRDNLSERPLKNDNISLNPFKELPGFIRNIILDFVVESSHLETYKTLKSDIMIVLSLSNKKKTKQLCSRIE